MSKRKERPTTPSTSDDEASSDETRLDWRMDPTESHSDWTIEIILSSSSISSSDGHHKKKLHATYHVHKTVLSVGFKRCGYFKSLLAHHTQTNNSASSFAESRTATSRIELHEPAAQAFPTMLDYLYSPWKEGGKEKKESWINAKNSVALHFLGRYFDCRALRHQVRKCWKTGELHAADDEALAMVYEHAKLLQEDKAYNALVARIGRGFPRPACYRLIEIADTQLWLEVLEMNHNRGCVECNINLSHLVAKVCSSKDMDTETFLKLSDPVLLPEIEESSVFPFLEAEKKHCPESESGELTSLQKRCAAALAKALSLAGNTLLTQQQQERLLSFNPRIYPAVLEQLLECTREELQQSESIREKQAKSINDFGYMFPDTIVIQDAGTRVVIGHYDRTDYRDGAPRYVLDYTRYYNGELKDIEISYVRRVDNWFIWIVDGEVPDEDFGNVTMFYEGAYTGEEENEKSPRLPPESRNGWSAGGTSGDRPLPRLEFYYEDD